MVSVGSCRFHIMKRLQDLGRAEAFAKSAFDAVLAVGPMGSCDLADYFMISHSHMFVGTNDIDGYISSNKMIRFGFIATCRKGNKETILTYIYIYISRISHIIFTFLSYTVFPRVFVSYVPTYSHIWRFPKLGVPLVIIPFSWDVP